jgi:hypothetical protein
MLKMEQLRGAISRHLNNWRGLRTDRKIVVIESDDWGSTCMPSAETFQKLVRKGLRVDQCPYTTFDSLACEQDLEDLFSVLAEFRDRNNTNPVITANTIMMNPDFKKIRDSGFQNYHAEPFTKTLNRYPMHSRSFTLWIEGVSEGLFFPQFHGREHLNISSWMKSLNRGESILRLIFEEEMFWPGSAEEEKGGVSLRAEFDTEDLNELDHHREMICDGLQQFENVFGYKSESFIAPNFVYHPSLNKTLRECGVQYLQGMKYQKLPLSGNQNREMLRRFHGCKNKWGQVNLVRNCSFEPSQHPENHDTVNQCMKEIENAFLWKKPATITAHRLNFIGYIDPANRERNLMQLRKLIKNILKKWPDIEFMTSVELGKLMRGL